MNKRAKKFIIAIIIICLSAIGVGIGVICFSHLDSKRYKSAVNMAASQAKDNTIEYDGRQYEYNHNLTNILFLGIDNESEVKLQNSPGFGGQADCIMILSMDEVTKASKILQISRDTMTDVNIYDAQGSYYTTVYSQIAAQYAYGNGSSTSCWAMKKTVGELLNNIPIYGYISFDIAGISIMNDYVGGVTLTIPEDYTSIDKSFIKGDTITLNGRQAEQYVRYRDVNVSGSNNLRMQRQVQYIPALKDAVKKSLGNSEEKISEFNSLISPYIVSDLTVEDVKELTEYEWDVKDVVYVPGKVVSGKETEEFYVDDKRLEKIIVEMFYKLK